MVVTESMRLYPPAHGIARQAARATTIAGQPVAGRFHLSLAGGQRITPTPYITLRPEPGIRLRLARR